jgi:PBP1b-binding outer membrane lipoprotein LpoB
MKKMMILLMLLILVVIIGGCASLSSPAVGLDINENFETKKSKDQHDLIFNPGVGGYYQRP